MKHLLAVVWLALVALGTPVAAQTLPPLTGRVIDSANVIPAAGERKLAALSERLEHRTSDQLVIVTVPSVGGTDIATYATDLANKWGIGQKRLNNGVLILLVPSERKVRIATGLGLEGLLTDSRSAAIVTDMLPYFRMHRYAVGLERGERQIISVLLSDTRRPQRKRG